MHNDLVNISLCLSNIDDIVGDLNIGDDHRVPIHKNIDEITHIINRLDKNNNQMNNDFVNGAICMAKAVEMNKN